METERLFYYKKIFESKEMSATFTEYENFSNNRLLKEQ